MCTIDTAEFPNLSLLARRRHASLCLWLQTVLSRYGCELDVVLAGITFSCLGAMATYMKYPKGAINHKVCQLCVHPKGVSTLLSGAQEYPRLAGSLH